MIYLLRKRFSVKRFTNNIIYTYKAILNIKKHLTLRNISKKYFINKI